jgi:hypothetical protein
MAQYKYSKFLRKGDNDVYDKLYKPGTICANSGIYRCNGCGKEDACNKGDPLPPQNHHQHAESQGEIRWQLIVFASSS